MWFICVEDCRTFSSPIVSINIHHLATTPDHHPHYGEYFETMGVVASVDWAFLPFMFQLSLYLPLSMIVGSTVKINSI